MTTARRITFFLTLAVLSIVSAFPVVLGGCQSQPVAYTNTATPLSDNLLNDFDKYTATETDETIKGENTAMSAGFRTAIIKGDAKVAASKWFGSDNIRSRLLAYWSADPKFESPGGVELMQIKVHNVEAFDYILTVGESQQSGNPPSASGR